LLLSCSVERPFPEEVYCCCFAAVPLCAGWCAFFTACRDLPPNWGAASYCYVTAGGAASYCYVFAGGAASHFDVGLLAERCRAVDLIGTPS